MLNRKILMALGLAVCVVTAAHAAGLWPNFPIVGSAAYCSSTNTAGVPGTSSVCTTTTPIGPTIVTGLETVPADTNKASGANPQTVKLTLASFNALPLTYAAVSTTTALPYISASALDGGIVITSTGNLSPTTVLLPSSPIDGQQFRLSSTNSLPALTVTAGSSASVLNAPVAMTVSTVGASYGYLFRYRSSNTSWYRLQ